MARFIYLHEGRLFTVRADSPEHPSDCSDLIRERYWLCAGCAESMTLVLQNGRVQLRPLAPLNDTGRKPARTATRAARSAA